MKITRKFMIYILSTGAVLLIMSGLFLYGSLTHIDALEQLLNRNFTGGVAHVATDAGVVLKDDRKFHEMLAPMLFLIVASGLLIIILQLIYISRRIVNPLVKSSEFAYKLAKGQFPPRLPVSRHHCDEMSSLIKSLNFMRDRMQSSINKLKLSHQREKSIRENIEKANRLQSDFLASISPDLREPMNAIKGWTLLLKSDIAAGKSREEMMQRIELIHDNIDRLDNQVSCLLDLSKLHTEAERRNIVSFSPLELMEELVEKVLERCKKRDIALENHFSTVVPDKIMTDRDMLYSILNSIVNVLLELSEGAVKIAYGCDATEEIICFWLSPDFVNDELRMACKKFEQYSTYPINTLPTIKGSAILNLLIAASRARKLQGELTVEYSEGKYVFKLIFNTIDIETDEIMRRTPFQHAASNAHQVIYDEDDLEEIVVDKYSPPYGLEVIVADRDTDNCRIIGEMLDDVGCRTVQVDNAEQLQEMVAAGGCDVLVVDADMAESVLDDELQEWQLSRPIIVTASFMDDDRRRRLVTAGVSRFFIKPLDFEKVKLAIVALGLNAKNSLSKEEQDI